MAARTFIWDAFILHSRPFEEMELGVLIHAYNLGTWVVETGKSGV